MSKIIKIANRMMPPQKFSYSVRRPQATSARLVGAGQWYISQAGLAVSAERAIPSGSAVIASKDGSVNFLQVVTPNTQFCQIAKIIKLFKSHPIPEMQRHLKFFLWSDGQAVGARTVGLIKRVFDQLGLSKNLVDKGIVEDLSNIRVNKASSFEV